MITVTFQTYDDLICGFDISGHSGYAEEGSDIVCAAVSSAAIMAANTITEIQRLNAEVTENDGFLKLNLSQDEAVKASDTLAGLQLHLTALSREYPTFITVKHSEV